MNKSVLVIIAVVVVAALVYLFSSGQPAEAKPQPPSSGETGLVSGVQNQINFKTKASIAVKIDAGINDLKIMLASGADASRAKASLDAMTALEAEVATARVNLVAGGETAQQVDAWLKQSRWDELKELAAKARNTEPAPR